VSTKAATAAAVSELERARGREQVAYLTIRVLAVAAIAFVVITSVQARPAAGGQGEALGVAVALFVFCGATVAAMWLTQAGSGVRLAVLVIAVASAAALIGLQGNGAAFLGVFPPVCLAALVVPARLSAVVAGVAAGAVSVAWLANGRAPIAGIVLNDFGIMAFFSCRCSPGGCGRATSGQDCCSPSWSRHGPGKPRPRRWPNASGSPARCTTCSLTRCPAWC
jgi:hypothetical protein